MYCSALLRQGDLCFCGGGQFFGLFFLFFRIFTPGPNHFLRRSYAEALNMVPFHPYFQYKCCQLFSKRSRRVNAPRNTIPLLRFFNRFLRRDMVHHLTLAIFPLSNTLLRPNRRRRTTDDATNLARPPCTTTRENKRIRNLFANRAVRVNGDHRCKLKTIVSFLRRNGNLYRPILFPGFHVRVRHVLIFFRFSCLLLFFPSFPLFSFHRVICGLALSRSFRIPRHGPRRPSANFFHNPNSVQHGRTILHHRRKINVLKELKEGRIRSNDHCRALIRYINRIFLIRRKATTNVCRGNYQFRGNRTNNVSRLFNVKYGKTIRTRRIAFTRRLVRLRFPSSSKGL